MWGATVGIVLLVVVLYARSLHILPLSDDWTFIGFNREGLAQVLGFRGNYHFDPVAQAVLYLIYLPFKINPVPYHVVAIGIFALCSVLVLRLAWRLTGSFLVGVLAGCLFVLNGRQYEAVIWTLVSIYQELGLALYLGGMLFYLRFHAVKGDARARRAAMFGFYACMILAVFTYEQEVSLVVACALYRLLVVERGRGWNSAELFARGREWILEFSPAVAFFVAYLALKYWLAATSGFAQAPGTGIGLHALITTITIGLYQSFVPGIITPPSLLNFQHNLLIGIGWGTPLWRRALNFAKVLVPLGVAAIVSKPVYRWLVLWAVLVVGSTVLGIGYLASRYMLLFLVPGSILWAAFVVWIAGQIRRAVLRFSGGQENTLLRRALPALMWVPVVVFVLAYAAVGVPYLFTEEANWQQASDIESAAMHNLQVLSAAHPEARQLYLVNLRDDLPPPAGLFEHGAYIFQSGAPVMAMEAVPDRFPSLRDIHYVKTPDFFAIGTDKVISRERLDALDQQPTNLVVCLSKSTQQIEPWGPLCK